jgi:hypothetical protein
MMNMPNKSTSRPKNKIDISCFEDLWQDLGFGFRRAARRAPIR